MSTAGAGHHRRPPPRDIDAPQTMMTSIGTPLDVTAEEIHIETYFPADDATEAALRALVSPAA